MNVRQIPSGEAATLVAQWGYPRPIELHELRTGYWMTDVPQTGVVWLVEGPIVPGHWMVHVCTPPGMPSTLTRHGEVFQLIRWVAGLLGATRVYAPLGSTHPGWARYLQRCGGFDRNDGLGPYFDLPEV